MQASQLIISHHAPNVVVFCLFVLLLFCLFYVFVLNHCTEVLLISIPYFLCLWKVLDYYLYGRSYVITAYGGFLPEGRKGGTNEGNVLFNDALNTSYLWLYYIRPMVKDHSDIEREKPDAVTSWATRSD